MKKKVVVITGASSGIGNACALYLAQKGYRVYGMCRKPENVQMQKRNSNLQLVRMDVTDDASIEAAINQVVKREKKIDILINNAGIGIASAIELTTIEETQKVFDTNVFGYMRLIRQVAPYMRKQRSGTIVNVGSMLGIFTIPFQGVYCAGKFAIEGLTECLSMELKPFDIKVILIQPGDVKTRFVDNRPVPQTDHTDTDYAANYRSACEVFVEDEKNGIEALVLAKQLEKILRKKKPKLRYVISSNFQKLAISMHKYFSNRLFETIFLRFYKQKTK